MNFLDSFFIVKCTIVIKSYNAFNIRFSLVFFKREIGSSSSTSSSSHDQLCATTGPEVVGVFPRAGMAVMPGQGHPEGTLLACCKPAADSG